MSTLQRRRWNSSVKSTETNRDDSASETKQEQQPPANAAEEDKIKQELQTKDKQIAELQDACRNLLVEQENLRTRTRKEVESASVFSIQKFAKDLLDTVDILGMALNAVPESDRKDFQNVKSFKDLYEGVSMTRIELLKALKRHGVEPFGAVGQEFNPNIHQALFQVLNPRKDAGLINSVQKEGYMISGRVLRPAQVGIVKV